MSDTQEDAQYGYVPTEWICVMFVVLFSTSTILHLGEALFLRPRLYWLLPTMVLCGIGEIIGWSARLWSSKNSLNGTPFLMQISTTIIAPTFLTAGLYTILGLVISILGAQYSRLRAKTYVIIFVTSDVVALVVQAAGGGIASGAETTKGTQLGSNIMVAGIFLQLVGVVLYSLLATEFLLRFYFQKPLTTNSPQPVSVPRPSLYDEQPSTPDLEKTQIQSNRVVDGRGLMHPHVGYIVIGLVLSTVLVFIRTIYRTIELLGGWHGHIIRTEVYFNVLDAAPIVLAMFILNVLHPWLLVRGRAATK